MQLYNVWWIGGGGGSHPQEKWGLKNKGTRTLQILFTGHLKHAEFLKLLIVYPLMQAHSSP